MTPPGASTASAAALVAPLLSWLSGASGARRFRFWIKPPAQSAGAASVAAVAEQHIVHRATDIFELATPVRAASPFAAYKAALYALACGIWLLFGLFGRDPWKPEETLLVAHIVDAQGAVVFPSLSVGGVYLWLAAAAAAVTEGILPAHEGARLANVALLAASGVLVWLCLAKDYGARRAWVAVLLLLGSAGLVVRGHLLSTQVFELFAVAGVVYGVFAWQRGEMRYHANLLSGLWVAASIGLLLVGNELLLAVCLAVAVFVFVVWSRNRVVFGLVMGAFLLSLWAWKWLVANGWQLGLQPMQAKWAVGSALQHSVDAVRIVGWSLLPVLPLAVVGVVCQRGRLDALQQFLCWLCALLLVRFFLEGEEEEDLYMLLPPLAMAAAMLLAAVPNEVARLLDLFAVVVVGVALTGGIWLVWLALTTGTPAAVVHYLNSEWAGFALPADGVAWWAVAAAVALAVAWLLMVQKFGYSKERAVVNWMCSVTLAWASFSLLLVGYVDSGKSYRFPAVEIRQQVVADAGDEACVFAHGIGAHWRAQLRYFGVPLGGASCRYHLNRDAQAKPAGFGESVWSGGRRGSEAVYHLYRRF